MMTYILKVNSMKILGKLKIKCFVDCCRDLADGLSKCDTLVLHFRHRKCCEMRHFDKLRDFLKD
eukprot:jgi/Botrbrau1/13973/Bobra.117_2s0003.1